MVDLNHTRIDDIGAFAIADAIKQSNSLATLNLSLNSIGATGASSIADATKQSKSLTALYFGGNAISDFGAAAIADAIKKSTSLMAVDLSCNRINDVGASAIADAMKQSKSLITVDLSGNWIGAGASAIADAIKKKQFPGLGEFTRESGWFCRQIGHRRGQEAEQQGLGESLIGGKNTSFQTKKNRSFFFFPFDAFTKSTSASKGQHQQGVVARVGDSWESGAV